MLVENTLKKDDVVTIKLTSGEELLGLLVEDGPMHIKISRPVVLTSGDDKGIGMAPYLFTVALHTIIKMSKMNITVVEKTSEQATEQYLNATDPDRIAAARAKAEADAAAGK